MVDVYLVSGFLGSGKTTLLLRLLQQAKEEGKKPAVFMNEFGDTNIDGQMIETKDGAIPMREMLNGCICCTGSEQSEAEIQTILVEHPDVDVLFIETTGAAHPVEALDAVFSPLFADQITFKGIITVVDLQRFAERDRMSPQMQVLFMEQIRHANFIVANKMDTLTDSELASVMIHLSQLLPNVPLVQTTDAKVNVRDIFDSLQQTVEVASYGETAHVHHHLQSKSFIVERPIHRERFEEWVQQLPDSVYRMKGYVRLDETRTYSVQYAYGMIQWLPEMMKMKPVLVFIGDHVQALDIPESIYA